MAFEESDLKERSRRELGFLRGAVHRLILAVPFERRLVVAGVLVGASTGVAAAALTMLLDVFSGLRILIAQFAGAWNWAAIVLLPALGGLIAGWLTRRRYPEAAGHGIAEVARAITEKDGQVPAHVAWVKSLASAATIGFGGSAGLEGPVVQIGSSVGSALGRYFDAPARDLRTFVAAGAVGGLSAVFGIPLAGVFFTMEVILKDFANEAFPAVVVSSIIGAVVARSLIPGEMMTPVLSYRWASTRDLAFYAALGILCGILGRLYSHAIEKSEELFEKIRGIPRWTMPAFGGLIVGALTLVAAPVAGTGKDVIAQFLLGTRFGWRAPWLAAGKIAATSATLGSGGAGGALMTALYVGAAAGSGWGQAVAFLGAASPPGAFALAGLGATFSAAFSAPITGMLLGLELTRDYDLLVPIMVCCAAAQLVARPRAGGPSREQSR